MPESVFTQTMPALFAGGACCAVGVFEVGALTGAAVAGAVVVVAGAAGEVADFFERDFFGVAELSAVALLSAASAFFDVDFFFEEAVFESAAAFELEVPASGFFFFLLFAAVLESLLPWSPVCGAVCAQTETLPATSNMAPNKAM